MHLINVSIQKYNTVSVISYSYNQPFFFIPADTIEALGFPIKGVVKWTIYAGCHERNLTF